MTQCNTLNIKLSNLKLNKLKSEIKDGTEVTLKLSSNVVKDYNDENNFPHKLLLTNTQVSKLCKAFAYNRTIRRILDRLLGPLLKTGLLLIGNVLKPLAKSVLIILRLTAAASATDATIHK